MNKKIVIAIVGLSFLLPVQSKSAEERCSQYYPFVADLPSKPKSATFDFELLRQLYSVDLKSELHPEICEDHEDIVCLASYSDKNKTEISVVYFEKAFAEEVKERAVEFDVLGRKAHFIPSSFSDGTQTLAFSNVKAGGTIAYSVFQPQNVGDVYETAATLPFLLRTLSVEACLE